MKRRKPSSKPSQPACLPSPKKNTNYVYVSGFVLLPDDVLHMLSEAVILDYDYKDSKREWKLHKSQSVSVEFWGADKVNAMRVAQMLEAA